MKSLRHLRRPAAFALCGLAWTAAAQPPVPQPRSGQAAAQVDLTGYWVAQITEDWRWRMITPPKGDYTSVPLTPAGRQTADAWDPERDAATGEQCRAFGAGGLMRQPTRLRITWADDDTLKIESDAGEQVRLLRFGAPATATEPRSWQGHSVAAWTRPVSSGNPFGPALVAPTREAATARSGGGAPPPGAPRAAPPPDGALKVVTTNLRAGYLRKNGVPYGEQAVVNEYYDRLSMFGNDYLQVVSVVADPVNLATPFIVSNHFKREPDGSKWHPTPCATDAPLGTYQPPPVLQ